MNLHELQNLTPFSLQMVDKEATNTNNVSHNEEALIVPQEFICPITLNIMEAPVMTRNGVNFERAAIIAWLQKGSGLCPLTRTTLSPKDIVANTALANKIKQWCHLNGVDLRCEMTDLDKAGFIGFVPLSEHKHKKILKRFYGTANSFEQSKRGDRAAVRSSSMRLLPSSWRGASPTYAPSLFDSSEYLANLRNLVTSAKRAAAA